MDYTSSDKAYNRIKELIEQKITQLNADIAKIEDEIEYAKAVDNVHFFAKKDLSKEEVYAYTDFDPNNYDYNKLMDIKTSLIKQQKECKLITDAIDEAIRQNEKLSK